MTTPVTPKLQVIDWGLLPYAEAFARQQALLAERQGGVVPDTLVLVEHPSVVTLGRRGNAADLRRPPEFFTGSSVALHHIDRGGRATAHEPGQLVVYPVIALPKHDLRWYSTTLLGVVALVLQDYGLNPHFKPGEPGLWVGGGKIVSFGIAVKRWVACHGLALNVNNDLSTFELIVACGNPDETVTSMAAQLGHPIPLAAVKQAFIETFREAFGYGVPPGPPGVATDPQQG